MMAKGHLSWLRAAGLLLAVAPLASTGCATTTRGSIGAPATNAWLWDHDHDHAVVRFKDRPWSIYLDGQLTRESLASPPTWLPLNQIRLKASTDERAIPLELVREVKVVSQGRGALDGALIGAGAGALGLVTFAVLAAPGGMEARDGSTGNLSAGLVRVVLLYTLSGSALGAIVGAVIGRRDVLAF